MGKNDKNKKKPEVEELDEIIQNDDPNDPYNDPDWAHMIPKTPRRRGGSGLDGDDPQTDRLRRVDPKNPPNTPRKR